MTYNTEETSLIDHITSKLFQTFISGQSLDDIVNLAASLLEKPLIVIDLSYKVLAYSRSVQINDKVWTEYLEKGYCPYEFIAKVNNLQSVRLGKERDGAYLVPCPESNNEKLIHKIKVDNRFVGNILLISPTSKIKNIDYELITIVSKIISLILNKKTLCTSSKEVIRESFLYDLLERKYKDRNELNEHMKIAGISLPKNLCILEFDISNYDGTELSDNLQSKLHYFNIFNSVYYNNAIIAIADKTNLENITSSINKYLVLDNIFLGISKEFTDILECRKYYLQAHTALNIGRLINPEINIIYYHDIQYYTLLPSHDMVKNPLEYCHPALITLLEYDKNHSSDLYSTLYSYILNDGNIQNTAKNLYIHRNTVRYKIKKIVALTHIDFSKIEEISNIFISYRVMKYYDYPQKTLRNSD
ncbi:helix-turn-helix domain-containing protein [Clostridium sp. C8-1-8]|uniref:PucR family transcriptional regulator n=1 Tax=Clostridium sp. C8-1-8 TaxID=2698831 RepID=UPI00136C72DF|nr:helix-turn-helix domain-containing protein [Clostridium sp. C8-1-8]